MPKNNHPALKLLMRLLTVPGQSRHESEIMGFVETYVRGLKLPGARIFRDNAHKRIGRGDTGNLIIVLPGNKPGKRRLVCAHVDVVEMVAGAKPVIRGNFIVPAGKTALGADNRCGVAAILHALTQIAKKKLPHPPLTAAFTVQEELGLHGARCLDYAKLGKPAFGFNVDGYDLDLRVGAPFAFKFTVDITGMAAHAGDSPESGVSAALIFARAAERLREQGLWGEIKDRSGKRVATSNIGTLSGGQATNVVMPSLKVIGEARSHSRPRLVRMAAVFKKTFEAAAKKIRNVSNRPGRALFSHEWVYPGFVLPKSALPVKIAVRQIKKQGYTPEAWVEYGALDANWLNTRGIPTVTLGCGTNHAHSLAEVACIPQFLKISEAVTGICTDED